MTRAISLKLRSQRGASMLLALLFLLICSMVTASILMAAVSNAGKHRSNLEEHQIYLLSSAVSTLCDELNQSAYRGQYRYWETLDINTDPVTGAETTVTLRHFEQLEGTYTHISPATGDGYLKAVLLTNFDSLFAQEICGKLNAADFKTFYWKHESTDMKHTLTLTPHTGTELDGTPVHITLEVKDSYAIYITAYLDGLDAYQVEAELTPMESKPTVSTPPGIGTHFTEAMQWTLGWITILDEEKGGVTGS